MYLIASLINFAYEIFIFIIIVQVAVSWLVGFGVINAGNRQAQNLIELLRKITDPVYKPLRKYIPSIGGIDITPLIVILGLNLLRNILIGLLL